MEISLEANQAKVQYMLRKYRDIPDLEINVSVDGTTLDSTWWRHQMETFTALLALCAGNSLVPGEFPAQRPVTRFDVFFDLRLNERLLKQWDAIGLIMTSP